MALTLADVWQLDGWSRDRWPGQHRPSGDAARGSWSVSVEWNASRARKLRSTDGQLDHEPQCFRLPAYLKDRNASALWQADGEWMSHRIDSAAAVRYSALFPAFEADAMTAMIEREPVGADNVADLILLNYKGADFVGHSTVRIRTSSASLSARWTVTARMLRALEAKVGNNYLLAVTADHGMPSEPSSPDRRHFAQSIVDLLHERFDPEAKQLITSFERRTAKCSSMRTGCRLFI